ncbi:MAG: hypothetical protein AAGE37_00010 [Pseudomonadota bacterium]
MLTSIQASYSTLGWNDSVGVNLKKGVAIGFMLGKYFSLASILLTFAFLQPSIAAAVSIESADQQFVNLKEACGTDFKMARARAFHAIQINSIGSRLNAVEIAKLNQASIEIHIGKKSYKWPFNNYAYLQRYSNSYYLVDKYRMISELKNIIGEDRVAEDQYSRLFFDLYEPIVLKGDAEIIALLQKSRLFSSLRQGELPISLFSYQMTHSPNQSSGRTVCLLSVY